MSGRREQSIFNRQYTEATEEGNRVSSSDSTQKRQRREIEYLHQTVHRSDGGGK
jgi:hypothetical protein